MEIPWFRDLYHTLVGFEGHDLYTGALKPWINQEKPSLSHLAPFKEPTKTDWKNDDFLNRIWNLYALSRVNDFLLLPFQSEGSARWRGESISQEQYAEFFTSLGFTLLTSGNYSPISHEVVKVHQSADASEATSIVSTKWPGLLFGNLVFSRSGVEVRGGTDHVVKLVVENSRLYFTYRRLTRATTDLAIGWGSNSQWRTRFRRDYLSDGERSYNIDGDNDLARGPSSEPDRDGLTISQRIELCKNRCFVLTDKDDSDLWPYDDRFAESVKAT
jgi:hypothetical protein